MINMKGKNVKNFEKFNEELDISTPESTYSLENAKKYAIEKFNTLELKKKFPKGGLVTIDNIISVLKIGVECGYKFAQKSISNVNKQSTNMAQQPIDSNLDARKIVINNLKMYNLEEVEKNNYHADLANNIINDLVNAGFMK